MKKNVIKLNEAQLRKVVAESVKKVLREVETIDGGDMMGMWDGPMDGPTNDGMGYDDWLLSDEGLTEIKKKLIEVYGHGDEEFWTWDDAREIAKIVLSDGVSIDDAMKQYVLDEYDITAPEATENTVKMNEAQLRKMIAESVKRILKEQEWNESLEELARDLCDGLEDVRDYGSTLEALKKAVCDGYTIEELWDINNEDSTKLYDIISNYEATDL